MTEIKVDICVIGAGSGGLSVAAGASQMGAQVALIERGLMGGDCLNYGCVPSKSLLAAAHAAQGIRESGRFGVTGGEPVIDFAAVHDHVQGVIAGIAPHDSVDDQISLRPGKYVALSIRDTGTGILKEQLDQVFEPFFTTKHVGAGSGLGFSVVHGFVKQSGGTVYIESQTGTGTVVTLYQPTDGS